MNWFWNFDSSNGQVAQLLPTQPVAEPVHGLPGQKWGDLTIRAIKIPKPFLCSLCHKYSFLKVSPWLGKDLILTYNPIVQPLLLFYYMSQMVFTHLSILLLLFLQNHAVENGIMATCIVFLLLKYFHLSTFFWMFIEGKNRKEKLCCCWVFYTLQ